MIINKLQLINYESHDDTTMEFVIGINEITGPSDQGKSGIMRSLVYAEDNSPRGDAMISDWTLTPKGAIKKGEGTEVHVHKGNVLLKRIRSSELNGYTLSNLNDPLKALNSGVPAQVKEFFNFQEVNIQNQLDQHFLITRSGTDVAKFFNEMINLTDLDKAQTIINKRKLNTNAKLKICKQSIEDNTTKLNTYTWIDDLEIRINQLKQWSVEIEKHTSDISVLENATQRLSSYNKDLKKLSNITALAPKVIELENLSTEQVGLQASITKLSGIISKYNSIEVEFKKYAAFDVPELKKSLERLKTFKNNLDTREKHLTRLRYLYNQLSGYESTLTDGANRINTLKAQLPEEYPCSECGNLIKVGK